MTTDKITKLFKDNVVEYSTDGGYEYYEISDRVKSSMSLVVDTTHNDELTLTAIHYQDVQSMDIDEAKQHFNVDLSELHHYLLQEQQNHKDNVFTAVLCSFGM